MENSTPKEQEIINYLKQNPEDREYLKRLSSSELTDAICFAAISIDPYSLRFIPDANKTDIVIRAALEKNGKTIRYLNQKELRPWMCETAVKSQPDALFLIPDQLKSREMFIEALNTGKFENREYQVLEAIPTAAIAWHVIYHLIEKEEIKDSIDTIAVAIRKEAISYNVAKLLVETDGCCLRHVPIHLIDKELARIAVEKSGMALEYVPHILKVHSPELMEIAVSNFPEAICFVPPTHRTKEIQELAVQEGRMYLSGGLQAIRHPDVLLEYVKNMQSQQIPLFQQCVNPAYLTPEIAEELIKVSPVAIITIPDELKTKSMCVNVLKEFPHAFPYVPEKYLTMEDYLTYNSLCSSTIYLPSSYDREAFCKEFVKRDWSHFSYILESDRTKIVWEAALNAHPDRKEEIISLLPHPDLCLKHLKEIQNRDELKECLYQINDQVITKEFVLGILEKEPRALEHIPLAKKPAFSNEPQSYLLAEEYKEIFTRYPDALPEQRNNVPAELCLRATLAGIEMKPYLYAHLKNSINVYRLYLNLEERFGKDQAKNWTPAQLKALKNGRKVETSHEGGRIKRTTRYDVKENKLLVKQSEVKLKQQVKAGVKIS